MFNSLTACARSVRHAVRATPAVRARARRGLSITLTISTIVWALGVPLGVLIPQPAYAISGVTVTASDTGAAVTGVTYTASFTAGNVGDGQFTRVFNIEFPIGFTVPTSFTTCTATNGGVSVAGTCAASGQSARFTTNSGTDVRSAAVVVNIGPITNAGPGAASITVGYDNNTDFSSSTESASATVTIVVVPVLSGGGPANGGTGVPAEAQVDINSSANMDSATVTTGNVSLLECPGSLDATSCATPSGSNLCTSVALNSNTNIACTHANLTVGTTYRFRITTDVKSTTGAKVAQTDRIFRTGAFSGSNNTTAPRVLDHSPASGAASVGTNALITFTFPLSPEGDMKNTTDNAGQTNLVDSYKAVRVKTMTNGILGSTDLCGASGCTLTWTAANRLLAVAIAGGLTASTQYDVCLVGGTMSTSTDEAVKNKQGVAITADSCFSFTTGSGSDSTRPMLASTAPLDPANAATGVDRYRGSVRVTMSEPVDPTTATLSTVRLYVDNGAGGGTASDGIRNGTEQVFGVNELTISLDADGKTVRLGMKTALAASTRYCYEIVGGASGIKDLAGNAVEATVQSNCFTTGSQTDTTAPSIIFADCDNFKCVVHYSEGMVRSTVTSAANYALTCGVATVSENTISLAGKTITYNEGTFEAEIQGLGLNTDNLCRLTVTTATDLAGNAISTAGTDNVEDCKVLNSATTGGFIGTSGTTQDYQTTTNFATTWEFPQRCEPRTRITSKSSAVECEFKAPAALAASSTFTLTFPEGFTFSDSIGNTRAVPATSSWMNADLNGPAANIPVIASATCTAASRTCVVTTGTATIAASEMVRFELDRITTPSTPTTDSRITVIVKDANGVKQGETINPAPFTIAEAGARSISGKVCKSTTTDGDCADAGDSAIASMKVYCDQMGGYMTGTTGGVFSGHQEAVTDVNGAWTISGLSDGQYGCSLPPDPTTMGDIMGGNAWKNITVSGANVTNVDFDFTDLASAGQSLAVTLTGSATLASKLVDVFCNAGASDFQFSAPVMKVVTLNGSGNGSATMKLLGGKSYDCGLGPHMDFSAFSSGGPPPTPTFDFLPPPTQRVNVVAGTDPAGITFTLTAASNTITVNVCDGGTNDSSNCGTASSGTGIANVYVNAMPLACFDATTGAYQQCFGGFAQTNANGIATLKVSSGEYSLMANGPGLPPGDPVAVTVLTDGTVQQKGVTVTQVTMKLSKSSTTISGQILDESGLGIQYAHVNGERIAAGGTCTSFVPAGGFRDSPTDSSGTYTLYVGDGTWNVRAFAPAYGEVGCTTVVVSGASASGKNIQAAAADYGTITGTCPDGAFVGAFGTNGGNGTQCSEGTYSMKVKIGTYTVECFASGAGPCGRSTSQAVTTSGTTTVNFSTSVATGTVSVTITGITDAFVDLRDSSGNGHGTSQNASGVYTLKIAPGTYTLRGGSPKYGELCSGQSVTVTASATTTATCTPPANLRSVTGRITDGTSNMAGATVTLTDTNGKMFSATTGAQGTTNSNLSLTNVPDGTYALKAAKKGYESGTTTATVSGGNLTLASPLAMTPTSGTSGEIVTIQTQASSANYAGAGRVIATKGTGSTARTVVGDIDATTGQASLDLSNGTWSVKAVGDNGKTSSTSTVTVSGGSLSGSAPTLGMDTAISGFTPKSDSPTVTPKTGGVVRSETASPVSGKTVEVNFPTGALSTTDSSTGKVDMKLDPSVAAIDPGEDLNFVGQEGIEITPKDANGNTIGDTQLNSNCTIEIPYTDADVSAAGVSESSLVVGALNSNNEWETFPTTVDATNNILTVEVDHFSTFGILGGGSSGGSGSSGDATPPASPSSVSSSATSSEVTLKWTDPTDSDLLEIEVLRNNPPSTAVSGTPLSRIAKGVQQFIDRALQAATKYTYILRAKDKSGNSRNSSAVEITTAASAAAAPTTGTTAPLVTSPAAPAPTVATPTVAAPTAPGAAAIGLSAGDLVKSSSATAVYLVGQDGRRYAFPNETTYKSWYADYSQVKTITDAQLASLSLGGLITVRPGTWLVKIESDPKVYAVEPGGKLRWVETEARAKKLYGTTWNKQIIDVPVSFWVNYTPSTALGADTHPTGTLVKAGTMTYYIDAGRKLLVTSSVFAGHGFQDRFVRALDASIVYADGGSLAATPRLSAAGAAR